MVYAVGTLNWFMMYTVDCLASLICLSVSIASKPSRMSSDPFGMRGEKISPLEILRCEDTEPPLCAAPTVSIPETFNPLPIAYEDKTFDANIVPCPPTPAIRMSSFIVFLWPPWDTRQHSSHI